jgi:acetyl-CoA synthetase (ADP-forming)
MGTLSEVESKRLLAGFGIPFPAERLAGTPDEAVDAARAIGYPVVAKLCGPGIAHKTERGLVRLGLSDDDDVRRAAADLLAAARADDGPVEVLVARQVAGSRELIAGLARDDSFGMTVMVGVGGVLAEAVGDVAFRMVPITIVDADDMIDDLETQTLLAPFRGEPAVDRRRLANILIGLSRASEAQPELRSADLNPIIVDGGGVPLAVDALVEIEA